MTVFAFFLTYLIYSMVAFWGIIDNYCVKLIAQLIVVGVVSVVYVKQISIRDCKWSYLLAYGFRMGLLLFSVYGRSIAYLPFDGKDTEFFYSAVMLGKEHAQYGIDALVTVTVYLSKFLGDSRLLYQYIDLMISMVGIRMTDLIMQRLKISCQIRAKCLALIALFPSFATLNIIYSRESIVVTGTMISLYWFLIYLSEDSRLKRLLLLIASFSLIVIVCLFHAAPIAVAFGYLIGILFYDRKRKKIGLSGESIVIFVMIAFALTLIYLLNPGAFEKLRGITDVKSIAGRFMFESNLAAGSSYAQYVGDSDTWGRFFFFTPARMFYALFAPLPWEWRGIVDAGTFFLNSAFYLTVCIVAVVNFFRKNYWQLFNKWLVITLSFVSAVVGWGCVAFGTAIRHRDKFFLLFVILFALELRGKDNDPEKI